MVKDKKDDKPKKMWKIEGEAFEKVKKVFEEAVAASKEAHRIKEEKKKAYWDAIYEAIPDLKDGSGSYSCNTDTESLGFYVVAEKDCEHCDADILGKLLKGAIKVEID